MESSISKKGGLNPQRVLATLQQECSVLVAQLASQIQWLSKVNGVLGKDISLVSKQKSELLAASCDDRWFARFMNRMIEITVQIDIRDSTRDRNVLDKLRLFDIDASGLKFDRIDRLWIDCNCA